MLECNGKPLTSGSFRKILDSTLTAKTLAGTMCITQGQVARMIVRLKKEGVLIRQGDS